jgi:hypothetical protein
LEARNNGEEGYAGGDGPFLDDLLLGDAAWANHEEYESTFLKDRRLACYDTTAELTIEPSVLLRVI